MPKRKKAEAAEAAPAAPPAPAAAAPAPLCKKPRQVTLQSLFAGTATSSRARVVDVYDLYCCAGGYSTGAVQAGHTVKLAVDCWEEALECHAANHPDTEHLLLSLGDDTHDTLLEKLPPPGTDAAPWHLHGSPPCQLLSKAWGQGVRADRYDAETMAEIRRPYEAPGEARRPTLAWVRQIPIRGKPEFVAELSERLSAWVGTIDCPKLFIEADPGQIIVDRDLDIISSWTNQTRITVRGRHHPQEDSPHEIGAGLAKWYAGI